MSDMKIGGLLHPEITPLRTSELSPQTKRRRIRLYFKKKSRIFNVVKIRDLYILCSRLVCLKYFQGFT